MFDRILQSRSQKGNVLIESRLNQCLLFAVTMRANRTACQVTTARDPGSSRVLGVDTVRAGRFLVVERAPQVFCNLRATHATKPFI